MFDKAKVTQLLSDAGFGSALIAVLCDWYEESRRLYTDGAITGGGELFKFLDEIADDRDALCIFVVDNMLSHSASWAVMRWMNSKVVPASVRADRLPDNPSLSEVFFGVEPSS